MKGQTAIEFMSLMGLMMLISAVLTGLAVDKERQAMEYRNQLKATDIAENVAFQVEMALVQGDGYSRSFYLPSEIAGRTWRLQMKNETAYIEWGDSFATAPVRYSGREIVVKSENAPDYRVKNNGSVYVVTG